MNKFAFLLLLYLAVAFQSSAKDFTYTYNGTTLTYTILSETDKTCTTKEGYYEYFNGKIYDYGPGNKVSGDVIIPSYVTCGTEQYTVTEIGRYGFAYCTDLTSISIPETVVRIHNSCFEECNKLKTITIPSTISSIPYNAFCECTALTSVSIPESVTCIRNGAFAYCTSLYSIKLPSALTAIEGSTFVGCSNLIYINIPESVTSIYSWAFRGCSNLRLTIPSTITYFGKSAFEGCSKLGENLVFSRSVIWLESSAFANCTSLKNISFDVSTASIGNGAFSGCSSLNTVVFNSNVTTIGPSAFEKSEIKQIKINSRAMPSADMNSFSDATYAKCFVEVPEGTQSEYSEDMVWGKFKNIRKADGVEDAACDRIQYKVSGNAILVSGVKDGVSVHVYDMTGRCVDMIEYRSDGDNALSTPGSGIYILVCDGSALKVYIP